MFGDAATEEAPSSVGGISNLTTLHRVEVFNRQKKAAGTPTALNQSFCKLISFDACEEQPSQTDQALSDSRAREQAKSETSCQHKRLADSMDLHQSSNP